MGEKKELRKSKEEVLQRLNMALDHLNVALNHLKEAELECMASIFPNWQRKEGLIREARRKVEEAIKYKEK